MYRHYKRWCTIIILIRIDMQLVFIFRTLKNVQILPKTWEWRGALGFGEQSPRNTFAPNYCKQLKTLNKIKLFIVNTCDRSKTMIRRVRKLFQRT